MDMLAIPRQLRDDLVAVLDQSDLPMHIPTEEQVGRLAAAARRGFDATVFSLQTLLDPKALTQPTNKRTRDTVALAYTVMGIVRVSDMS